MLPQWFREQPGDPMVANDADSDALQRAVDSCAGACTLWLTFFMRLSKVSQLVSCIRNAGGTALNAY